MGSSHDTWSRARRIALAILAGVLSCHAGSAAETNKDEQIPRPIRPLEATNLLASFRVKPGFRIELAAAPPMVAAPVAMAFDEKGRLFVAEMPGYLDRPDQPARNGRIRVLEDTNEGDSFDSSAVYADKLVAPSAVACYDGGIFVAATPEILYLKDTSGDNIADVRKVVFAGFGGTNTARAGAFVNSFAWGLDNRIHGATAGIDGTVTASGPIDSGKVSLTGSDFAFNPRSLELVPEAGPAQSGLCFDSRGRKFMSDFTRPLRTPMYEPRNLARNPFFPRPPEIIDVASPATRVFASPPPEPRRPPGARPPRPNEFPQAPRTQTNALVSAWLTSARGCTIYRGTVFPTDYVGNAFVADPSNHIVHRFVLRENGLELSAGRAPDEANTEFLVSSDPLFRPTQVIAGPDGALYIADMRAANDTGCIYRVVSTNSKRSEPPQLAGTALRDLVAELAGADGWRRDTAARLLYERREPAAPLLLTNMLNNSRLPFARLHALYALDGLGALTEAVVLRALRDTDERLREQGVLLSEKLFKDGNVSELLWNRLRAMTSDPSLRVRYQLAFTLGELRRPDRLPALGDIIARSPDNRWIQAAVLSSLGEGAGEMFAGLASDGRFRYGGPGWDFMRQLATMIGTRGAKNEVVRALEFVDRMPLEPLPAFSLLFSLGDGLHRTRSSLTLVDTQHRLQRFFALALAIAVDPSAGEDARIEALRLLSVGPYAHNDLSDQVLMLVGTGESAAVQSAAASTLGRLGDATLAANLIARLPAQMPPLRADTIAALLARSELLPLVMNALENGSIRPVDLTPVQADLLRTWHDPAVRQRALRLLGPVPVKRPAVVQEFKPALGLRGVAARGRQVFAARCTACHQLGGEGQALGPDLVTAKIFGKERTLAAILEPSAEVRSGYAASVVETGAAEVLIGLVGNEDPLALTMRQPNGVQAVWPTENIRSVEPQSWSLMPEGLERGLFTQSMADLLEYIMTTPK